MQVITGDSIALFMPYVQRAMQGQIDVGTIMVGYVPEDLVWLGQKRDDYSDRAQHSAKTIDTQGAGGTNFMSPGSIAVFAIVANEDAAHQFANDTFNFLVEYFDQEGLKLIQEHNDLLTADNRKLSGYTYGPLPNKKFFCAFTLNINVNNKKIQQEGSTRVGFGLKEYGYSTEDVFKILHKLWKDEWVIKTS